MKIEEWLPWEKNEIGSEDVINHWAMDF